MRSGVKEIAPELQQINEKKRIGKIHIRRSQTVLRHCVWLVAVILLLLLVSAPGYLGDPGYVIYRRIRIGKDGNPFKMWKFRSMCKTSEEMVDKLTPE